MTTFPRGHHAYLQRLAHLKTHPPQPTMTDDTHKPSRHFEFPDPVDLRGIPVTGPGVGSTMRGTQPENACTR